MKEAKQYSGEKKVSLECENWAATCKRVKLHYLTKGWINVLDIGINGNRHSISYYYLFQ